MVSVPDLNSSLVVFAIVTFTTIVLPSFNVFLFARFRDRMLDGCRLDLQRYVLPKSAVQLRVAHCDRSGERPTNVVTRCKLMNATFPLKTTNLIFN